MKQTARFLNNLLGDPESYPFENRIFNAVMILVSLTGMITVVYNIVLDTHIEQIIISLLCSLFPAGCYIYAKKTKKFKALVIPTTVFFYIALSVAWFVTNGIHGSVPFFFFVLVIYCVVFIDHPFRLYIPGIITSIMAMSALEFYYPSLVIPYDNKVQEYFDVGISLVLCLIINGLIIYVTFKEYIRERILKDDMLKQVIKDKEIIDQAFKEIRVLKGFLPICSNCKKIKDDNGSWQQLETYIHTHSEAKFSHGICPDCAKELYPGFVYKHTK